jgi:hypothetical protein
MAQSAFTIAPISVRAPTVAARFQVFLAKGLFPGVAWGCPAAFAGAGPPFFFLFHSAFGFFFSLLLLI